MAKAKGSSNPSTGYYEKRTLLAILIGAVILSIALIAAIIAVYFRNQKILENSASEETSNQETSSQYGDTESEIASINEEINALDETSVSDVIRIYQSHIDAAKNESGSSASASEDNSTTNEDANERLVSLLNARIFAIQAIDLDLQYGDQVIADTIAIDDILQTPSSAGQVMNQAALYNNTEILETYQAIVESRYEASGVVTSLEGEG